MTWRELAARVAGALGFGPRDRDLQEELAFHRDQLASRHRAHGLDSAEAHRRAAIALGGGAQIADTWRDQRGLPFLDALGQDVRYGIRMLRRTPGFTSATLVTLALGIAANTAIFTVVNAVLLRPLPYAAPERLVTVGDRNANGFSSNVGFATVVDWRERSRTFESFAMMRSWAPTLSIDGEAERIPAVRVSWNYLEMLGIHPALGRGFTADDDRPDRWRVLLLSDALWRRRFGADPAVVGRSIVMNDVAYEIIGVLPAGYQPLAERRYSTSADAQMWAPIGYAVGGDSACRSCQHLRGFGLLKPGVTVAQAQAEMNAIRDQMRRQYPNDYETGTIAVVPMRDALTGDVRAALLVLLGAVGFVMLIAAANVANLLLARSVTRQNELTLRATLGAGRGRIVRQLLTESVLLSAAGAAIGVGVAAFAVRELVALAPVALPRSAQIGVDSRVLAFTAALAVFITILFGVFPAWHSTSRLRGKLAVDTRTTTGAAPRARALLVVADLVLALVLLAGAGLMLRTVNAMTHASPGFDAAGVASLSFSLVGKAYVEDAAVIAFQHRALEKLRALPGVTAAALVDQIPFGTDYDCRGFHAKGRMKPNTSDDPCIERYGATDGYLSVMGIPLVAGRAFDETDSATSQPVVLVSESTARLVWGGDNPIGAQVRVGSVDKGPWRTVVGVVGDVHHDDVTVPAAPSFYTPESQMTDSFLVAVLKSPSEDDVALSARARAIVRELDPTVPVYDVAGLPALVKKSGAQRLFVTQLLAGFAAAAVLLAAVGLYGVVAYGVAQRTREVGVRLALGAQPADVLRLVLASGFSFVGVGIAAGVGASLAATRYLGTLVFGVGVTDPLTFAGAAALLTVVALVAHWIPLRRALRIDPAIALRTE
jgi:putative ABC transport system permease protein